MDRALLEIYLDNCQSRDGLHISSDESHGSSLSPPHRDYLISLRLLFSAGVALLSAYYLAATVLVNLGTVLAIAGAALGVYSVFSYATDYRQIARKNFCIAQVMEIRDHIPRRLA